MATTLSIVNIFFMNILATANIWIAAVVLTMVDVLNFIAEFCYGDEPLISHDAVSAASKVGL